MKILDNTLDDSADIQEQVQPLRSGRHRLGFSSPILARTFGEFCLKVMRRELTPVSDDLGGYAIPEPQIAAEIAMLVESVGVAARLGRIVPMGAGGFRKARRVAGATAYWKTPGVAGTPSTPSFGALDLRPETLMALVDDDLEFDEDLMVNVGQYLASEFVYALAAEEDRCAFVGTGAPSDGGIVGILNSDRVTVVDMASTKDDFQDVAFSDLANLEGAVVESALDNARFLFHRSIKALVKQIAGTNGSIWQPAAGAEPSTLMGYRHAVSAKMPAVASNAVSTTFLAFGDFNAGLYVGRRGGIRIDYSDHANFANGQRVWRALERVKIGVMGFTAAEIAANASLGNPIAVLKTAASD